MESFLILLLCLSFFNNFLTFLCLCILVFNRLTVMNKNKQNILLIEEMKKYIKEYFKHKKEMDKLELRLKYEKNRNI